MPDPLVIDRDTILRTVPQEYRVHLVGSKACGLLSLPAHWSPPFTVITTAAFLRWKSEINASIPIPLDATNWLVVEGRLDAVVDSLVGIGRTKVIVRSSATTETLRERGLYDSVVTDAHQESVLQAIAQVWNQTYAALRSDRPEGSNGGMATIIQPHIRVKERGHLSNERRVSRLASSWVAEFEPRGTKDATAEVIRVKSSPGVLSDELKCATTDELRQKLRVVACINAKNKYRCHFEWVWDGQRLWIVQADIEDNRSGSRPGGAWTSASNAPERRLAQAFVAEPKAVKPWKKIDCVRKFRECGAPVSDLYVLEDPRLLRELSIGLVSPAISADLEWLLQRPLVIRTDVAESVSVGHLLLPRTDAVRNAEEATDFLVSRSKNFVAGGVTPDQFCFIAHWFIPAMVGAWSFARPNVSRVRVDSTWGIPDGLNYYPHDSFEVDLLAHSNQVKVKLRCKTQYIDVTEDGKWRDKDAGTPWDWKRSLANHELVKIAEYTQSICKLLNKPVSVMFFVDIDQSSGHPPCLPWHYETNDSMEPEKSPTRYTGVRFWVTNDDDLKRLEHHLIVIGPANSKHTIMTLKPKTELLREPAFVKRVAEFASSQSLPVELEGSTLSHAYYILTRGGVRVRCQDPFQPNATRQKFGKLVRDLIPVKIESHGEVARTYQAAPSQLVPLLKAKAVEESLELYHEDRDSFAFEELADLLEVVETICVLMGQTMKDLHAAAEAKRVQRGGFKNGVVLLETREVPLLLPQPSNSDLFGSVYLAPQKGRPSRLFLAGGRKPSLRSHRIVIPLIPPDRRGNAARTVLSLDHDLLDAVVQYTAKEVIVYLQRKSETTIAEDSSQLVFSYD